MNKKKHIPNLFIFIKLYSKLRITPYGSTLPAGVCFVIGVMTAIRDRSMNTEQIRDRRGNCVTDKCSLSLQKMMINIIHVRITFSYSR